MKPAAGLAPISWMVSRISRRRRLLAAGQLSLRLLDGGAPQGVDRRPPKRPEPPQAQPTSRIASWQACSQRRQASAQIRQCPCWSAWRWHSCPQTWQAVAQT